MSVMYKGYGSAVLAIAGLLGLAACSGDSEAAKKRLLDTGNKFFKDAKYKEASIIYRKLLQKDARYGEAYYRLGLTELKQGRYGDAVRAFRRSSELQPENDDAHSKLGDLYLMIYLADKKKFKPLLSDFQELSDRLLKRNPKHYDGLRMKGYLGVASENWPEAIKNFTAANEIKPNQGRLMLELAQSYAANNQLEEAEKTAKLGLQHNAGYPPLYDFLYFARLKAKDVAGAEGVLRQKVASNTKSATFILELAAHYYREKKQDTMLATLKTLTIDEKKFPEGHRLAGDFLFRTGDVDGAYKEYEAGIKSQPKERAGYQKKQVELLAMQGRRKEAVDLAQQLVDENKDDGEATALRAALRLQGGNRDDVKKAIQEFLEAIKQMPDNPVVRFNLGEAYLANGEVEPARVQLQEAVKLRSTYIPPKLALSRIHLSKQEYAKTQQLADEVLAGNPNQVQARILRISALMGMMENGTARKELEDVKAKNPDLKDAYYLQGMIDLQERKFAESEKSFLALYNSPSPDVRGLLGLVEVYLATGRAAQSRKILEDELKRNPPNKRNLRLAMANVDVRSERYEGAVEEYKKLIEESPQAVELWLRLGETYRRWKHWDEALATFDKAKQLAPNEVVTWMNLAMAMEQLGKKPAETKSIYERILKLSPDNAVALNNMAFILAEAGQDLDQALTYAQKAKQQMPDNPDISDTLGWVYIKKNLSDDAIKIFRGLLDKKPGHVTWRYHLAMALFQKGDKLQAKKELEQAIKNKPNPEEAQKINTLLSRIG